MKDIFYAILHDGCLKTGNYNKKLVFKNFKTALNNYKKISDFDKRTQNITIVELKVVDILKSSKGRKACK
jgi:hypothetical protein